MKHALVFTLAAIALFTGCAAPVEVEVAETNPLVSMDFKDNNTWIVVCRGFPLNDTNKTVKIESAKKAAVLNAYHFIRETFNDNVVPDRDGKVEKMDVVGDYAVVKYVVRKKGLRSMLKNK